MLETATLLLMVILSPSYPPDSDVFLSRCILDLSYSLSDDHKDLTSIYDSYTVPHQI